MKILIKNPAPSDPEEQVFWGDTFFGRSLARCLEAEGNQVAMTFWEQWDDPAGADLLLMLRGTRQISPPLGSFGCKALWVISHPEDVSRAELDLFDVIFCAATDHAQQLRAQGYRAYPLLQCTDDEVFHARGRDPDQLRHSFVFVGNGRDERTVVHEAMADGLPLKIWGRGWERYGYQPHVVRRFIPNADLGALYRQSFCTLNDHWADMSRLQYVNNRVFDALACGLPVLSDAHEGLAELGFGGIRTRAPDEPFRQALDRLLVDYDQLAAAAAVDSGRIAREHTFTNRAREIIRICAGQGAPVSAG
jgi:spore maturation protein CgeB